MTNATTPRIAVLGAGHVGPVIARLALHAGYRVAIATSGNPGDLALITQLLIPGPNPDGPSTPSLGPTSSYWRYRCIVFLRSTKLPYPGSL